MWSGLRCDSYRGDEKVERNAWSERIEDRRKSERLRQYRKRQNKEKREKRAKERRKKEEERRRHREQERKQRAKERILREELKERKRLEDEEKLIAHQLEMLALEDKDKDFARNNSEITSNPSIKDETVVPNVIVHDDKQKQYMNSSEGSEYPVETRDVGSTSEEEISYGDVEDSLDDVSITIAAEAPISKVLEGIQLPSLPPEVLLDTYLSIKEYEKHRPKHCSDPCLKFNVLTLVHTSSFNYFERTRHCKEGLFVLCQSKAIDLVHFFEGYKEIFTITRYIEDQRTTLLEEVFRASGFVSTAFSRFLAVPHGFVQEKMVECWLASLVDKGRYISELCKDLITQRSRSKVKKLDRMKSRKKREGCSFDPIMQKELDEQVWEFLEWWERPTAEQEEERRMKRRGRRKSVSENHEEDEDLTRERIRIGSYERGRRDSFVHSECSACHDLDELSETSELASVLDPSTSPGHNQYQGVSSARLASSFPHTRFMKQEPTSGDYRVCAHSNVGSREFLSLDEKSRANLNMCLTHFDLPVKSLGFRCFSGVSESVCEGVCGALEMDSVSTARSDFSLIIF
ncbi:hypothetical protein ADUPG1_010419 [Aduncisulcus paluster]|uniref:Uncharacterized protein n=1 Tax=Aduncisulcus paluster TaxID=2918883 RepID=A0ABQ5JU94_9EUKA|nr:hypothetical protein ADUPG1_010419 [Aduncisulcus paluster]